MIKKTIALIMALAMLLLLTACLKQDGSEPPVSAPPSGGAGSTGNTVASGVVPPPQESELESAYLTGLEKGPDYPEGQRITGVMLNNVQDSRPQNGIGDAQMLVEIRVEGGITRFMALYEDYNDIPRTGGLRSARDQFFQLLIPTQGFYVHEGPSQAEHPVNIMMRNYNYQEFDITRAYPGFSVDTDSSRSTRIYNWYDISAEGIQAAIETRELDTAHTYTSSFFRFHPYNEEPRVPLGGAASSIEVPHTPPTFVTYFDYDAQSGRYAMSMNNGGKQATIDNNTGNQVMFDNVIVIFAPFALYDGGSGLQKVDYGVGGGGFYFSRGGWEPMIWRKGPADSPLLLYNMDETEMIAVNPGTTYLAVVDDTLSDGFYESLI